MNPHFVEILAALSAAGARFLIVGAHALAAHGLPRATGDLDIWVDSDPENARHVWRALVEFGAPLDALDANDLTTADLVFQIGLPPSRIDLMTGIDGVAFQEAWRDREVVEVDGQATPIISRHHLIRNKRATGRPQDLVDADRLEARDSSA